MWVRRRRAVSITLSSCLAVACGCCELREPRTPWERAQADTREYESHRKKQEAREREERGQDFWGESKS